MIRYPNVTLLIQGPVNESDKLDFIPNLDYYSTLFSEIILSTYTEHISESILDLCKKYNIKVVTQPNDVGLFELKYNIGRQVLTTLAGVKQSSNPYTLKHRTDERYSNLEKLVDKFLLDPTKWVSGTTVFGENSYFKFHAADHLYVSRTDLLIKTFDRVKEKVMVGEYHKNADGEPAAESTFTRCFLEINGEAADESRHNELMKKYFDIVNDKEFMPFVIRINSANAHCTDLGPYAALRRCDILTCNTIEDFFNR